MSRADEIFIANCRDILENGTWDTDREVRPRWADGTPAHTIKKFGQVSRYDLREEFPILTIRRTYLKSAIDEILWIWRAARLARRTATSWGGNISSRKGSSTRWTRCCTI